MLKCRYFRFLLVLYYNVLVIRETLVKVLLHENYLESTGEWIRSYCQLQDFLMYILVSASVHGRIYVCLILL